MKAIIQAGGKGTRLRNITKDEIPKPMVPILGKPLLQWQIETLVRNGINEIYLIVGHLGDVIQSYFGDGAKFGVSISYVVERELLGTGGGLYYLRDVVKDNEHILFLYGDVFFDIDIARMEQFHLSKKSMLTAFVHPNSHPYDSDVLELDENQQIISFLSKKEERKGWYHNVVNAACYILDASIIHSFNSPVKTDFEKDVLRTGILENKPFFGYRSTEFIKDAGTEERLLSIEADIESGYIGKKNLKQPQKCIFLDRDGTINKLAGFVDKEEKLELIPQVENAIKMINRSEYLAICVTNQPVVARGMCSIEEVEYIHKKMETLLGQSGAYLDDIIFCPHHPDRGFPEENPLYKMDCNCRKPNIGMLQEMEKRYNINLSESWIIGDTTIDIMTGKNANMHTLLVHTGEAGCDGKYDVKAERETDNLEQAVELILNDQ